MPLGMTVPLGWGVISMGDNIKVIIASDKQSVENVDRLMEQFEKNMDAFLGSTEWRKFH